jgi:hypothetical protein
VKDREVDEVGAEYWKGGWTSCRWRWREAGGTLQQAVNRTNSDASKGNGVRKRTTLPENCIAAVSLIIPP